MKIKFRIISLLLAAVMGTSGASVVFAESNVNFGETDGIADAETINNSQTEFEKLIADFEVSRSQKNEAAAAIIQKGEEKAREALEKALIYSEDVSANCGGGNVGYAIEDSNTAVISDISEAELFSDEIEDGMIREPNGDTLPIFYINNNNDSMVSAFTGALTRTEKLVSIPVAGDIDIDLNLKYNSGEAWFKSDVENRGLAYSATPIYGVAAGWGYDLPYLDEDNLYLPKYGAYEVKFTKNGSKYGDIYSGSEKVGYLSIYSYSKKTAGIRRYYDEVYTKNGEIYYFTDDKISKIQDRFGNYVTFETSDTIGLSKVTDSFGRTVNFSKAANGVDIIITLPNNSTILLDIATQQPDENFEGENESVTVLAGVTHNGGDASSAVASHYTYTLFDGEITDYYGNGYAFYPSALLTYGINNQGAINEYEYETVTCKTTDNYTYTAYRISSDTVFDSFDTFSDCIRYTYEGDYTGNNSEYIIMIPKPV